MMICDSCGSRTNHLQDLPQKMESLQVCDSCSAKLHTHLVRVEEKCDEFRSKARQQAFLDWKAEVRPAPGPAPSAGPGSESGSG